MKKVELLSPVGNIEMLYYAIHNGADAVYLSGKNYGARKFSNNFTNEELESAIKYSHLYNVLVYVTVNTLIYEYEVESFLKYIEFLYKSGVDAVIMQDIGMIKLVREKIPNLEIHASTQCHTTNEETVKLFKELGCTRVVMAREVSLDTINKINVPIEKEIFVYGALCVCYSGCCLFSSLNGGRSGNRGECVGSCRLPYKLLKNNKQVSLKDKYLLSTKDLNTLPRLEEILKSNVDSLKIEGRMKSPYYVGYITRLYRTLIDKYYNHEPLILTNKEVENMKQLFNREFTEGYLLGKQDITNIKSPNHIGIPIGKVIKTTKDKIYINLTHDIAQEDGIRFKSANKGMIINKLYTKNNLLTNKVLKGNICLVDNKLNIKSPDIVLRTISTSLNHELKNYQKKQIPVTLKATLKITKPLSVTISDGTNTITEMGDTIELAQKHEVTYDNIKTSLTKLGSTPFICKDIQIIKDDNVFINLKSLNEIRRNLTEKLIHLRENKKTPISISNNNTQNNFIYSSNQELKLNVLVRNEEQLKACLDNYVDNIYITDYNLYEKYKDLSNVYYKVPRVNDNYQKFTNAKLLVSEMGSVIKYRSNNYLIGDYSLNVTNSQTIKKLNQLGLRRVTLSPELTKDNIVDIMNANYNVELIIYGHIELMIMKYCPLKKCLNYCKYCQNSHDKFALEDKFGNKYHLLRKNCYTTIMHSKTLNIIDTIASYKKIGITNYRLELLDEDYKKVKNLILKVKNML